MDIVEGYEGIGYAKSTDDELRFVRLLVLFCTLITQFVDVAKQSGMILDPVYTGKAFIGLVRDKRFAGRNVLFIHTGGLFGMYDKTDQVGKLMTNSWSSFEKFCS